MKFFSYFNQNFCYNFHKLQKKRAEKFLIEINGYAMNQRIPLMYVSDRMLNCNV